MAITKSICSDAECNRRAIARGLCSLHYKRHVAAGMALPPKMKFRGSCSVEGCGNPHHIRGFCQKHFARLRRYGDPLFTKTAPEGEGLQFLNSLFDHQGEECVTWPFSRTPQGYGQTFFCAEVMGAHRVMCILKHGEPPTPDHQAAHSCGKGRDGCVNPKHLRWATPKENIADKFGPHGWRLLHANGRIAGITR